MVIGNPSSASIAASVWAFSGARQLSSFAVMGIPVFGNPSVGAGAILDLRPAASRIRDVNVSHLDSASWLYGTYDGTTFTAAPIGNTNFAWHLTCGPATGAAIKNSTGGALPNQFLGVDWT